MERLQRCIDKNLGLLEGGMKCCPFSNKDGCCTFLTTPQLMRGSDDYDPELLAFVIKLPRSKVHRGLVAGSVGCAVVA